jgi:hypothetical protein
MGFVGHVRWDLPVTCGGIKHLKLEQSLYSILQILSVTLFEKNSLSQAFSGIESMLSDDDNYKQLNLLV